ncbi:MAG: hypothetical protein PHI03_03630 [Bacteroidales bacterium]|nr:hypothetical protein [Bacteroidales bacterium]MDY0349032.1 hypothetical protein [Tenuifilaceae bacterium]
MTSIANRWYWLCVGLGLALAFLVLCSLLYFVVFRIDGLPAQVALGVTILLYTVAVVLFFRRLLPVPTVKVDEKGILVSLSKKNNRVLWGSIVDIDFYRPNGFLHMNTITISTTSFPTDVKLHTAHYANRKSMVQVIKYAHRSFKLSGMVRLQDFTPKQTKRVRRGEVKAEKFEYISHSPFGNPRSYFPLIGLLILYKLIQAPSVHTVVLIIFVTLIVLSFFIATIGMARVGVSDSFVVFSSFYYPYRRYFRFDQIDSIFFEYPTKNSSKAARVITVDGGQKLFTLANFTKANWVSLGDALVRKKVKASNR